MDLGLSIALGLVVVISFILLDRRDKRALAVMDVLVEAHRLQLIGLLERQDREREAHRQEIQTLCNRLQHPEFVIHQPDPAAVAADEEMPLSDEQMAERELMLERIEKMENEGILS